jgi:hypothetical protein
MAEDELTDEKAGTLNYQYVLNKAILDVMKANKDVFSPKGDGGPQVSKEEALKFRNTVYLFDVIAIPWTTSVKGIDEKRNAILAELDGKKKLLDYPDERVKYIDDCLAWFREIIKALDSQGALIEHGESVEM